MRARFVVCRITREQSLTWIGNEPVPMIMTTVELAPDQEPGDGNSIFGQGTPHGVITLGIRNEVIAAQFEALFGKALYVDFTPASFP